MVKFIPLEMNPLMADSRPEPTPLITTLTSLMPKACALSAKASPTLAAAKGVPFFAPLKPRLPLEDQARALPLSSASKSLVLLYVDST